MSFCRTASSWLCSHPRLGCTYGSGSFLLSPSVLAGNVYRVLARVEWRIVNQEHWVQAGHVTMNKFEFQLNSRAWDSHFIPDTICLKIQTYSFQIRPSKVFIREKLFATTMLHCHCVSATHANKNACSEIWMLHNELQDTTILHSLSEKSSILTKWA